MEQNKINLTIDNCPVSVDPGTTILDAAKACGIEIPTLCHLNLKGTCVKNQPASCRMCVVEVSGRRNLAPACATACMEGMEVRTNSLRVLNARKTILELLLSNHPHDCLVCPKSGKCELQDLARKFNVKATPFDGGERNCHDIDRSVSIVRDMDKCILCRKCETMCNEVQTVGAIGAMGRGFDTTVAPAFSLKLSQTDCSFCGQCVAVCPVGALSENDNTGRLIKDLADPEKIVVVQTAPAVRVAIGEEFGYPAGTIVTGKLATALRKLGFDYVFDTDFAADLTIMEEGSELLGRLRKFLDGDKSAKLPILTSCCPAWVNFFEHNFSDMLDLPSTARSPQQMFGSIAKTWWAEMIGVPREKIVVVSVMPCLAKKFECEREEFRTNGNPDVDYSISTRELASLIKEVNIDFRSLEDSDFDAPLGESTGASVIFGATGGVMEAALRTAYEIYTGKTLDNVDFTAVRGLDGIREAAVDIDGFELKVAVAFGLGNARSLMEEIKAGKCGYHAIEIMACPGGCVGGGGQPFHRGDMDIVNARRQAVYKEDCDKPLRKSHENPYIQKLYKEFFGEPLSEKAHTLLHTHYHSK